MCSSIALPSLVGGSAAALSLLSSMAFAGAGVGGSQGVLPVVTCQHTLPFLQATGFQVFAQLTTTTGSDALSFSGSQTLFDDPSGAFEPLFSFSDASPRIETTATQTLVHGQGVTLEIDSSSVRFDANPWAPRTHIRGRLTADGLRAGPTAEVFCWL